MQQNLPRNPLLAKDIKVTSSSNKIITDAEFFATPEATEVVNKQDKSAARAVYVVGNITYQPADPWENTEAKDGRGLVLVEQEGHIIPMQIEDFTRHYNLPNGTNLNPHRLVKQIKCFYCYTPQEGEAPNLDVTNPTLADHKAGKITYNVD